MQVDNEDLIFTLETVVERFGEEMAPYAVGLTQHLAAAFWRMQVGTIISTSSDCIYITLLLLMIFVLDMLVPGCSLLATCKWASLQVLGVCP